MTCTPDQKHLLATALTQHHRQLFNEAEMLTGEEQQDKMLEALLARRLLESVETSQYVSLFTEVRTASAITLAS